MTEALSAVLTLVLGAACAALLIGLTLLDAVDVASPVLRLLLLATAVASLVTSVVAGWRIGRTPPSSGRAAAADGPLPAGAAASGMGIAGREDPLVSPSSRPSRRLRRREPARRGEPVLERDGLTGLAGLPALRSSTRDALALLPAGGRLALLVFDLDRVKDINGYFGYHVGDLLLRHVGERLAGFGGSRMTAVRLTGDRFALLVPALANRDEAGTLAAGVLERLSQELQIEGCELVPSTSVGVAVAPDHGNGFEPLMRSAEMALDEAKRAGGGRFWLFDPRLDTALKARKAWERELRRALDHDELALHFQPQINLRTGAIVACEALLRWRHPERGMVSPATFVPIAESCGLIRPIGAWVLTEAVRAARRWHDAGFPLRVAVNVSPAQLKQQDIVALVRHVLAEAGLDPCWLELEVTESLFVDPTQITIRRSLTALAEMGVQLAIDDFGTGYSSLSYLKRLPVSRIKIDKSFLREIGGGGVDEAIVRAIIGLAKTFGKHVLAEGVESEAQQRFLAAEGCDEAQGFHLGRPMPEAQCLALVAAHRAGVADDPARKACA